MGNKKAPRDASWAQIFIPQSAGPGPWGLQWPQEEFLGALKGTLDFFWDAAPPCPPHWGTSWSNLDQLFAWGGIQPLQNESDWCQLVSAGALKAPAALRAGLIMRAALMHQDA